MGVAFLIFGAMLMGCCWRRYHLSQLRELHHAVIIENTLYARSVPRITWRVGTQLGWWQRRREEVRQRGWRRVHAYQLVIDVGGAATTAGGAEDGQQPAEQQNQQLFVASLHNSAVPSIRRREEDRFFYNRKRWGDDSSVQQQLQQDAGVVMRLNTVPDTPGNEEEEWEEPEVKDGAVEAAAAQREQSVSRLPPAYEDEDDPEAQHVVIEMVDLAPMQHRAEGEAGVSPRAGAGEAAARSDGQLGDVEPLHGKAEAEAGQQTTATDDSPVLVLSPAAEDEKEQQHYEAVVALLLREKEEQEAKLAKIAQQLDNMQREEAAPAAASIRSQHKHGQHSGATRLHHQPLTAFSRCRRLLHCRAEPARG